METDAQLRDLAELDTDSASSPFVDVTRSLDRGETAEFTLAVAVRGAEQSLALSQPGVYPALVNVNGRPDFGGQARLAAVSMPLPVLSVPRGPAAKRKPVAPGLTFVWPLLDTQPRRLPTTDGQTLLADDELADSLAVGGRLLRPRPVGRHGRRRERHAAALDVLRGRPGPAADRGRDDPRLQGPHGGRPARSPAPGRRRRRTGSTGCGT